MRPCVGDERRGVMHERDPVTIARRAGPSLLPSMMPETMTKTRLSDLLQRALSNAVLGVAVAASLSTPARAQAPATDGPWEFRIGCSANASNGRPSFEWKAQVAVQGGQFAHRRGANAREPYDEAWSGQFRSVGGGSQISLGATGSRPNSDRWELRFAPATVQQNEATLTGGLYARAKGEEVKVRDCTAVMKRLDAPTDGARTPAAAPVAPSVAAPTPAVPAGAMTAAAPAVVGRRPGTGDVQAAASQAADAWPRQARDAAQRVAAVAAPIVSPPAEAAPSSPKHPGVTGTARVPGAADGAAMGAVSSRASGETAADGSVRVARVDPPGAPAAGAAPAAAAPRAGQRSPGELRRALYDDPGFDLALVVPLGGSGNLKRTLDGKWTVASGSVSVGTMGVLASDHYYDLKGFPGMTAAERGTTIHAGPFYKASLFHPNPVPGTQRSGGFSGPAPMVATGVSANPAVRSGAQPAGEPDPDRALKAALGEAIDQALTRVIGKPVPHGLVYQSTANVVLVPRHKVDPSYQPPRVQGQWISRIEAGEAEVLGYITQQQLRQALSTRNDAVAAASRKESELLANLANSSATGADGLIGAITVRTGVNVKPCALNSELDLAPYLLKHEPIGAWITQGAPRWSQESPRGFDTAEALFDELKSARRCTAVFGRGPMIAKLAAALDRDRVGNLVYPQPQPQQAVRGLKAKALGFDDVAALDFAESIGTRTPRHVSALRGLGVGTRAGVDQARERLKRHDAQASSDLDVLIALLQDEAEARKQGVSIEKLHTARAARAAKEAKEAAAAQREMDKRVAKDFPYAALVRCRIGDQTVNLMACMTEGGLETEIELRNGADYRMYKVHDVQSLGRWSGEGVAIDLRAGFAMKAQNASKSAVLDVVIRDRASGSVKFQKSAARFGVISVQN